MNNRSASMNQYGTSYKRGTLFFPKALRKKVYIVYAFVRVADQLVDTPEVTSATAAKNLYVMQQKTASAWAGKEVDDELISAFVAIAKEHDFAWEWIEAFFAAMHMDTEIKIYTTYAQLQEYMHGSAEVIGLMMTQLIGYTGEKDAVFALAKKLGEAMQYTNFLRDVAEDWQEYKRIYMPLERLSQHGLLADDVGKFVDAHKADDRWTAFCQQEVLFTQELYMEAMEGILLLNRQGRFSVRVAALLYAGILRKIERVGYDQCAHDAHTTKREKFRLFLGALKTYAF